MISNNRRPSGVLAPLIFAGMLAVAIVIFAVVRGASTTAHSTRVQVVKASTGAVIQIPQARELFEPFIQTVQIGTTVSWQNQDSAAHTITTTWDHSSFLNPEPFSLVIPAKGSANFTLTKAGVYDYFETTAAMWNTMTHRVAAKKGSAGFPLAMEGIIWVQGPINGLAATATESIPDGQDDFSTEFLAISTGGSVSWHNRDTDTHFIALVPNWSGPINPADVGVLTVAGTSTVKGGATRTITFTKAGLYYYYCPSHAAINTEWKRAQAHTDASLFPTPMEAFVLVAGQ